MSTVYRARPRVRLRLRLRPFCTVDLSLFACRLYVCMCRVLTVRWSGILLHLASSVSLFVYLLGRNSERERINMRSSCFLNLSYPILSYFILSYPILSYTFFLCLLSFLSDGQIQIQIPNTLCCEEEMAFVQKTMCAPGGRGSVSISILTLQGRWKGRRGRERL